MTVSVTLEEVRGYDLPKARINIQQTGDCNYAVAVTGENEIYVRTTRECLIDLRNQLNELLEDQ